MVGRRRSRFHELDTRVGYLGLGQEIYRPGTAISDALNLRTPVGGDQNKEFRGNASFLREKGPRGAWNKNKLLLYFPY